MNDDNITANTKPFLYDVKEYLKILRDAAEQIKTAPPKINNIRLVKNEFIPEDEILIVCGWKVYKFFIKELKDDKKPS